MTPWFQQAVTTPSWITNDIALLSSKISEPSVEPVDLEFLRMHRKQSSTSNDLLYDLFIPAARQHFETITGWQCITCTWEDRLDCFPYQPEIQLSRAPLQEIVSVTYDTADGEVVLDSAEYRTLTNSQTLGSIALAVGTSWPTAADQAQSVRIRYLAGFGDAPGDVPELVKWAVLMLAGHFDKYREEMHEATNTLHRMEFGAKLIADDYLLRSKRTIVPKRQWLG